MGFKKIILDDHSWHCSEVKNDYLGYAPRKLCELNMNRILIQIETHFLLLIVPRCSIVDKYVWIEDVCQQAIDSNCEKTDYPKYGVNKSVNDSTFKNHRLRGEELQKWVSQIHYSYSDASGKMYYVTSDMPLFKNVFGDWNDKLESSFNESYKYINENHKELIPQLESLYKQNKITYRVSESEVFKTIDFMSKSIRKQVNN